MRLRSQFLSEHGSATDYWASREVLQHYDLTFGTRIRWKWMSVCEEIVNRGELSKDLEWIADWGCGTAGALRVALKFLKIPHTVKLLCSDRSTLALEYSLSQISNEFPQHAVSEWDGQSLPHGNGLLLVSHLITELGPRAEKQLLTLLGAAPAFIWVEPGTPRCCQKLVQLREKLRSNFRIIAPCPHESACGLLAQGANEHWCHNFASVPAEAFQDRGWKKWSDFLQIDLRSLPVSFLAMAKQAIPLEKGRSRVLGRPWHEKGLSRAIVCTESAVGEEIFRKKEKIARLDGFTALLP